MKKLKEFIKFYEIKENGDVLSKRYSKPLNPFVCRQGYAYVDLYNGEEKQRFAVHRLVATIFLGYQEGKEINHIDKNRLNNNVSNLEWVTRR